MTKTKLITLVVLLAHSDTSSHYLGLIKFCCEGRLGLGCRCCHHWPLGGFMECFRL